MNDTSLPSIFGIFSVFSADFGSCVAFVDDRIGVTTTEGLLLTGFCVELGRDFGAAGCGGAVLLLFTTFLFIPVAIGCGCCCCSGCCEGNILAFKNLKQFIKTEKQKIGIF
jgi:hypothetical protein